jgi:hypothetical protein
MGWLVLVKWGQQQQLILALVAVVAERVLLVVVLAEAGELEKLLSGSTRYD